MPGCVLTGSCNTKKREMHAHDLASRWLSPWDTQVSLLCSSVSESSKRQHILLWMRHFGLPQSCGCPLCVTAPPRLTAMFDTPIGPFKWLSVACILPMLPAAGK